MNQEVMARIKKQNEEETAKRQQQKAEAQREAVDLMTRLESKRQEVRRARPKLHPDMPHEYLDWLASHNITLAPDEVSVHLKLAELLVRSKMGDAQAKATQHTLVEDGTIKPPPVAS